MEKNGEENCWACWSRTERDRRQDWKVCTGKEEEEGRIGKRAEGGRRKEKSRKGSRKVVVGREG